MLPSPMCEMIPISIFHSALISLILRIISGTAESGTMRSPDAQACGSRARIPSSPFWRTFHIAAESVRLSATKTSKAPQPRHIFPTVS